MVDPVLALDRAPRWLRRSALAVAAGRGPAGRLYDALAHPVDPSTVPPVPPPSTAPVRILLGPANEAEQGYQWARAFERSDPRIAAVAMTGFDPGGYGVRSDLTVRVSAYLRSRAWHDAFETYLRGLTHLLWESNLPLLGRRYGADAVAESRVFADHGVRGGLLFHGSDIRSPRRHAQESEWSPFLRAGLPVNVLEEKTARNRRRAVESGLPIYVSTPDLLRHAPGSTWCPIVVDPHDWSIPREPRPRDRPPVVVHAPSNPLLKGSNEIEPVLRRLEAEGLLEYRVVRGIPYAEMPQMYAAADIVLDHFLVGNYSMVTIEALASGCLVIGHVDEQTRDAVRASAGVDVPVLEADVRSLEGVLRAALAGGDEAAAARAAGRSFVERVHDGRHSAQAVRPFLALTD